MENKKKIYRRTELALVAIVLLVCTAILVIMCTDSKRQAMEGIRHMSSGWYYMENGQKYMVMELKQRMQGVLSLQRAHSIIR